MKKLLVVDDHLLVRHGLAHFINSLGQLTVGGEAGSGAEALQMLAEGGWDMVVLDISLKASNSSRRSSGCIRTCRS